MWLSLLISRARESHSQDQTIQQSPTEVATAETEGILVQIGLKVFLGQAMIGAQNKYLGIADDNVHPMEKIRITRGILLADGLDEWHWVLGVGWRQYSAGGNYIHIINGWNNSHKYFYKVPAGSLWITAREYWVE